MTGSVDTNLLSYTRSVEIYPVEEFVLDNNALSAAKVYYIGQLFRRIFWGTKEIAVPGGTVNIHVLRMPSHNRQIYAELAGKDKGRIPISHFFKLLSMEGCLSVNEASIAYVMGNDGKIYSLHTRRNDHAYGYRSIYADPVESCITWSPLSLVLSS